MSAHPSLEWNMLIIEANRLGRRMKVLAEATEPDTAHRDRYDEVAGVYEEEPAELHRLLWGIAAVLKVIGETPNAHLNAEGIAAIRSEMERAALIERTVKPILDEVDPTIW